MNGWQRVWVVCCVVLILAPVYVYRTYIPSDAELNGRHQQWIDSQLAEIKIIEEPVQNSNRLLREVLMQTPVPERLADIERTKVQHAEFMLTVSKQRPITIAELAGAWLAACGLLYFAGLITSWIARGFKKQRIEASA
ncbi:hypothetical protein D3C76_1290020 [compost metagenome]